MKSLPLILVLALTGCIPEGDVHYATTRQEIQGGQVENSETAVVGILAQVQGGSAICSGTLIAPNLVLTAQHCVAELNSQFVNCGSTPFGSKYDPSTLYVTTKTQMSNDPNSYTRVSQILIPPGGNDTCGFDIALLVLNTNISSSDAIPIVPRIDSAPVAGEVYTAIGYGHIGNETGAGTRRSLANRTVRCIGDQCPFDVQAAASEFEGSDGTCQGDSGGAPLDNKGRVLGALSRGPAACAGSVYSSVYAWRDWLREQGGVAATIGGYAPHAWVTAGISEVAADDLDSDGILNQADNCAGVPNADQADEDGDGQGDICDDDADGDGVLDGSDNCPVTPNSDQQDRDSDGKGDLCDTDDDGDGVDDRFDNCPTLANADQADSNGDEIGDICAQSSICDRYNPDTGLFDGCSNERSPDAFVIKTQPQHIVGNGQLACSSGDPSLFGFLGLGLLGLIYRRRP